MIDYLKFLRGIEKLQQLNFKNIKINAVLLKGMNDTEKDFNRMEQLYQK